MRIFNRNIRQRDEDDEAPLDAIAVTLALWLGLVVAVTGLVRMSERAAIAAQQTQPAASPTVAMKLLPYGS